MLAKRANKKMKQTQVKTNEMGRWREGTREGILSYYVSHNFYTKDRNIYRKKHKSIGTKKNGFL